MIGYGARFYQITIRLAIWDPKSKYDYISLSKIGFTNFGYTWVYRNDQQCGDYAKDVLELDTWKLMSEIPKIPLRN